LYKKGCTCYEIFQTDCRPTMSENDNFSSDDAPVNVAEADKTSYFIGLNDVLTNDEKILLTLETQSNGRFSLLKTDSELTNLSDNFIAELAGNEKCSNEMKVLDSCLRNQNIYFRK
jgi:hypothetical protein